MQTAPYFLKDHFDNAEVLDRVARHEARSGCDVIAASPWLKGPCEMANRIVLRDTESDYVVHMQVCPVAGDESEGQPVGKPFFTSGNYLHKSNSLALQSAWAKFCSRSTRLMNLDAAD
jgi:hypothetical protein